MALIRAAIKGDVVEVRRQLDRDPSLIDRR